MPDLIQIPGTQFITRLGDEGRLDPKDPRIGQADADIVIGGSSDLSKFISNINASKWDDEFWLNINNPAMTKGDVKSFDNGVIVFEQGGIRERYFLTTEKRPKLEYDIMWASYQDVPKSMEVRLNLSYSNDLEFHRQDVAKMIPGSTYAPNVPGSYSVRIPKRNNKYRTGKFCHFYMPEFIELKGFKRRGFAKEFWIENGQIIIVPPDWVKNATYPVILDPTIGHTSEETTHYNANSYTVIPLLNATTDGTGGRANTIYVFTNNNTLGSFKTSLYDADSAGNRLLSSYTVVTGSQANDDWTSVDVSGDNYTLLATTAYFVSYAGDSGGHELTFAAETNAGKQLLGSTFGDEMANPGTTLGLASNEYSVYLEYEPAVGGIVPQAMHHYRQQRV